jgi:glutathione synthase/RimK-type ligase-like ATP-grasp enzyme
LTDFALRIPQRINANQSFGVPLLIAELNALGVRCWLSHYEDPCLFNRLTDLGISCCVAATSYYRGYRHLVNSIVPVLQGIGMRLIPTAEHVLAYENKSMQVAVGRALHLKMPPSFAVATAEEFQRAAGTVGYPFVLKGPEGFGSASVSAVSSGKEMEALIPKLFSEKARGTRGVGVAIVQQFLPGLSGDWKVIVTGCTAASLYRRARPADFRASGSGLFEFRTAPSYILEFANAVRVKLGAPWVSCDIAETQEGAILIEYQVVHFGTTTVDKAPEHAVRDASGNWEVRPGPVAMEKEMARAVLDILEGVS